LILPRVQAIEGVQSCGSSFHTLTEAQFAKSLAAQDNQYGNH